MSKLYDELIGDTADAGSVGIDAWSDGTIEVSAHTLRGSQFASLSVAQVRLLINDLEAAIAAVEANTCK